MLSYAPVPKLLMIVSNSQMSSSYDRLAGDYLDTMKENIEGLRRSSGNLRLEVVISYSRGSIPEFFLPGEVFDEERLQDLFME